MLLKLYLPWWRWRAQLHSQQPSVLSDGMVQATRQKEPTYRNVFAALQITLSTTCNYAANKHFSLCAVWPNATSITLISVILFPFFSAQHIIFLYIFCHYIYKSKHFTCVVKSLFDSENELLRFSRENHRFYACNENQAPFEWMNEKIPWNNPDVFVCAFVILFTEDK